MFLYTALGDSITAGSGASSPGMAYPSLLVSMLQHNCGRADGAVLAEPGWTSAALDAAVFENSAEYLARANAITIWIGGDNVAFTGMALLNGAPRTIIPKAMIQYGKDLGLLILTIRKVSRARLIVCTQYNPFPNSPLAAQALGTLNGVTETVAGKLGCIIAPAHAWFAGREPGLIAHYRTGTLQDALRGSPLPIHPNNAGHRVIAQGLYPLVRG